ncbi:MAG: FAD/NAD(P)-binding protein [Acidimicrobiales bacterium]
MESASLTDSPPLADPFLPDLYRVVGRRVETDDVVTLWLEAPDGRPNNFRAGQFNMLTAFGVGEVAISISSAPRAPGPVEHTVRDVGAVSHALCNSAVGAVIGVRGPFGNGWGVEALGTDDVVVVAGGIGLAPLRGVVRLLAGELVACRAAAGAPRGSLTVLVGARTPEQIVFTEELEAWRQSNAEVLVTVDAAGPEWDGQVGVVTSLIPAATFDRPNALALICGPEIMMRFTARALIAEGVDPKRILVSLERNMQCGIGLCGHCQLGPLLLCRDGPVARYLDVQSLVSERER